MKLVDNWKDFWKMWSIRINAFLTIILIGLVQFPEVFLHLWLMLPEDIRQNISTVEGSTTVFIVGILLSTVARLIQQKNLHKKEDTE